jgi:hypothetical protein
MTSQYRAAPCRWQRRNSGAPNAMEGYHSSRRVSVPTFTDSRPGVTTVTHHCARLKD